MRKLALGTALTVAALAVATNGFPADAEAGSGHAAVAVSVSVSSTGGSRVGTGFAGFSYEKAEVGADLFNAQDTSLVQLFRLLGPNVVRIGGNTADETSWNPNGAGGSSTEIAPSDVTKLAAFLKATGWKVIYGINLKTNTAANAVSEAKYAAGALGTSLAAFEIGNEPNFYDSESTYEANYAIYVKAITAALPNAVFDGPGEGDSTSWAGGFGQAEKNNHLQILSTHEYIGSSTSGTIPVMLASTFSGGRFPAMDQAMQAAEKADGTPQWRVTETNSFYHGGTAGVSNVEAASLWSLDMMAGVAVHGGAGVNFHGGTSNYSPIVFSGITPVGVQGVYYGQLLWALAGAGAYRSATVTGGSSSVTAWGIGRNVLLDNESGSSITATVKLSAPATTALDYVLTAPSLASTAVTIAGSGVSGQGTFHPAPHTLQVSQNTVVVTIPADSAGLLVTH